MPAESDRFGLHKKRPDAVRPHLDDVGSTVGAAIAMQFRTKERCERAQVTDLVAIRAPFTDQQSSRALPRGFPGGDSRHSQRLPAAIHSLASSVRELMARDR